MVVKKKINKETERFIDKGAEVKAIKEMEFKTVLIRIPMSILMELDAFLKRKKPWVNRTQWIIEALYGKLREVIDDGEEYRLPED
jgi:hypothetical protein